MDLTRTPALPGPNPWSPPPSVQAGLPCTPAECQLSELPGFETRLRQLFPDIGVLRSDGPGQPVALAHALELATLGLQAQAGCPVTFSRTTATPDAGVFQVVVEYTEEAVGRLALEQAMALCRAAADGSNFDLADALTRLRDLDEDQRLGPSTGSIVDAAAAPGLRMHLTPSYGKGLSLIHI